MRADGSPLLNEHEQEKLANIHETKAPSSTPYSDGPRKGRRPRKIHVPYRCAQVSFESNPDSFGAR